MNAAKIPATYITEAFSCLVVARETVCREELQLTEPVTVSGWYTLATPTADGMTSAHVNWRAGRFTFTHVCRTLRPLTEDEQDRLARLDDEERSDYLDALGEAFEADRAASLERAVDHLDAHRVERLGLAVYYAAETQSWWLVSDADLAKLGDALREDSRDPMAYSEWCAGSSAEEIDLDAVIRDSEITESTDLAALAESAGAAGNTITWLACDYLADEIRRRVRDAA